MPGFSEIIGHEHIIRHLKNAIRMDKVSHAYIFNGENLSGKMMLAEAFAMALQCERGEEEPCMECHSCKQAVNHNQPDIIYLSHEKPNTISVEDIRTQLNQDIGIKPYSSKRKIYIVDEAEKMNVQAQNALLKTIEEPPSYGVILLMTTNADLFLPTILSRCVTLTLKAVPDATVKEFLIRQHHIPKDQADICVAFAQGNVGKALQLTTSESFGEMKASALRLVKKIGNADIYEMPSLIKKINDYKTEINDYLDLLTLWFRDVLLLKADGGMESLVFADEIFDLRQQASKSSFQGLNIILQEIHQARIRLGANVNFDLVMELLLVAIKENMKEKEK